MGLDQLRQLLHEVDTRLGNARGATGSAVDVYNAYISWVHDAVRTLSQVISSDHLARLVLTPRYWALQAQPTTAELQPMRQLLNAEIDERLRVFRDAVEEIETEERNWNQPGALVLPDTSFYVTHDDKIEDADVAHLLSLREVPIRILVPILVIDELDGLKRSGNNHVRWRAAYTLAVFDRLLTSVSSRAVLREADFDPLASSGIPRGKVTIEVFFDPPGHARLSIADDEIVSRALAAQARSKRSVRMITYDTGQAMRARHAGLEVTKLQPEFPAPPTSS